MFNNQHKSIFTYLTGSEKAQDIVFLNDLLKQLVETVEIKPRIFLHYSIHEHTYHEHIQALIQDLTRQRFTLHLDEHTYQNHNDVAIIFPKYLLDIIHKLLIDFESIK